MADPEKPEEPKPEAPKQAEPAKPAAPKPAAPPKEKVSQAVPAEPGLPVLPAKPGMTPEAEAAVAAASLMAGKAVAPGAPGTATTGVAGEPKPGYARMTPMAPGAIVQPPKSTPAKKEEEDPRKRQLELSRRKFLGLVSWSTLGWGAFTGASAAGGAVTARFMFPNVLYEPPATVKVGFPDDYPPDYVEEKFKDTNGVWVVRTQGKIFALTTICTHLGCTPNWLPNEGKFKCPCHGSGFRATGVNFEGPAPRPLERAAIKMLDDGQMLVDKSKKFQFEKGQWDDPDSFIPVI
ncbi:MAG: ubiquinol-cytochrome c reductase iron-sulfur subunit [Planctomycetota bacterium]